MPSKLKSDTARANGAKSKGPRTPTGLAKSSRNSLSHGFTARNTIILEYENPEEFQQMLADYRQTYEPATAAEKDLVDQMIAARWRIRRMWTIETALLDCEIVRRQAQVKKEFTHIDGAVELAQAFRALADESRSLALVSRYESRLYRMHDRAYAALRELQNQRKSPPASEEKMRNEPKVPPPNEPKSPSPQIETDLVRQAIRLPPFSPPQCRIRRSTMSPDISPQQLRGWQRHGFIPAAEFFSFSDLIALRALQKLHENRVPQAKQMLFDDGSSALYSHYLRGRGRPGKY